MSDGDGRTPDSPINRTGDQSSPIQQGPVTFMGPIDFLEVSIIQKLNLRRSTAKIVSGAIPVKSSYMLVDTEGGAASDNLDTINGGSEGDIVVLMQGTSGDDVVIRHGQDNIYLNGAANFTLDDLSHTVTLIKQQEAKWVELARGTAT